MSISEISPITRSSRSFNSPVNSESRQDVLSEMLPVNTGGSPSTPSTTCIIAIAVKAHEKMQTDPFGYVFHHLIEQQNCKVVVISCLSRVRSELGHYLTIDEDSFGGSSKKKLGAAVNEQRNNWNHFLKGVRERFNERGIELDISIPVGRKSEEILVQAAKALHPMWVVLDSSWSTFSGQQHKIIQAGLPECNLVLLKKNAKPQILNITTQCVVPARQSHDQVHSEEDLDGSLSDTSSSGLSFNGTAPTLTSEASSSNGTSPNMPTISTDASTSNRFSPSRSSTETAGLYRRTPTLTTESSTSNATNSAITTETSSSNGSISPITTEASSSSGTTATTTTEMAARVLDTNSTATSRVNNSKTESRTSARAPGLPSPPPTQAAKQRFKGFFNPTPVFPHRSTPSLQSPRASGFGALKPTLNRSSSSRTSTVQAARNTSSGPVIDEDIPYDVALAFAMEASIASAVEEGIPVSPPAQSSSSRDEGGSTRVPSDRINAGAREFGGRGSGSSAGLGTSVAGNPDTWGRPQIRPSSESLAPSAPPLPSDGPISYPSVDTPPVNQTYGYAADPRDDRRATQKQKAEEEKVGRCVICWDGRAEAVCIPCGHLAACKNCLTQAQQWGCPVCRTKIQQVLKVYSV